MGYLELVSPGVGGPGFALTGRGEKLLQFVTTESESQGCCEICGDPADPYDRGRVEDTLATLEKDYGVEISITLCCTRCLTLPEHLLRRVGSMLRRWRNSGGPRTVQADTWVIDPMELTGFLDARYRPAQYYLDVQPRRSGAPANSGAGRGREASPPQAAKR
jgi:hypothetical protein